MGKATAEFGEEDRFSFFCFFLMKKKCIQMLLYLMFSRKIMAQKINMTNPGFLCQYLSFFIHNPCICICARGAMCTEIDKVLRITEVSVKLFWHLHRLSMWKKSCITFTGLQVAIGYRIFIESECARHIILAGMEEFMWQIFQFYSLNFFPKLNFYIRLRFRNRNENI